MKFIRRRITLCLDVFLFSFCFQLPHEQKQGESAIDRRKAGKTGELNRLSVNVYCRGTWRFVQEAKIIVEFIIASYFIFAFFKFLKFAKDIH